MILQNIILICRFVAQETFVNFLSEFKTVVLLNIFAESMIIFFQESLMNRKLNVFDTLNVFTVTIDRSITSITDSQTFECYSIFCLILLIQFILLNYNFFPHNIIIAFRINNDILDIICSVPKFKAILNIGFLYMDVILGWPRNMSYSRTWSKSDTCFTV